MVKARTLEFVAFTPHINELRNRNFPENRTATSFRRKSPQPPHHSNNHPTHLSV